MKNKPALIFTVIIALIAIASTVFAVIIISTNKGTVDNNRPGNAESTDFEPTEELQDKAMAAVQRLVNDNYKLFSLYSLADYDKVTHFEPEPYDHEPEDGYYTLKEDANEFKTSDEIFSLLEKTYVREEAERIKTTSAYTEDNKALYIDKDGRIGVNATFEPMKDYDLDWKDVELTFEFESDGKCSITVPLKNSKGEEVIRKVAMVKGDDGEWRLEEMFF